MKDKSKKPRKKKSAKKTSIWSRIKKWLKSRSIVQRIGLVILAILVLNTGGMYLIAQWYIQSNKDTPTTIGATFTSDYASYFGLNPQETMKAMITDLGIKQFRLVSYWNMGEPKQGTYDFTDLDWQFKLAEDTGSKVSLAIGLRQPRWPECHMPAWADGMPMTEWEPLLKDYMKVVMERYKDSSALESYQLENEFFLNVFGICPDFSRDRLIREYDFVKSVDSTHPVIITRSNNALGFPIGDPQADKYGVSVYKRVWDKTITRRYAEYPFPDWFYAFLAGGGKILTGKDMFVHELQTEAWLPDNGDYMMNDVNSIPEQNKSLNAKRLADRIRYGEGTGMKELDMWGVEWWYWRKTIANDPSLWDTARTEFQRIQTQNEKLSPY